LAWGVLTGFWELFKVAKKLDKYDKSNFGDGGSDSNSDSGGGSNGA